MTCDTTSQPCCCVKNDLISNVRKFTEAVGCSTDSFNPKQIGLYIGLQIEEMAEKIAAILNASPPREDHTSIPQKEPLGQFHHSLVIMSENFKAGTMDNLIRDSGRQSLLDADIDLAWVTLGSAFSQGADVAGAAAEVARANLAKIGTDGLVAKDENGKVMKPEGWTHPDLSPFVCTKGNSE